MLLQGLDIEDQGANIEKRSSDRLELRDLDSCAATSDGRTNHLLGEGSGYI